MRFLLVLLLAALPLLDAGAQDAVKIRLGTLAPRGTTWHRALLEMGEKWRAGQGAGAAFIVYTDGSQGSEADMVRRMRIGQLNAALLSVVGLNDIDDSVTALQKMPMIFRSWEELDYVREKLRPTLEKRFLDKGFVVLCWGDAGWVRFFSKSPVSSPTDLRKLKLFAWAGDSAQADIMKALGYQPVVARDRRHPARAADRDDQRAAELALLGADAAVLQPGRSHARHELGAARRRGGDHAQVVGQPVAGGTEGAARGGRGRRRAVARHQPPRERRSGARR